MGQVLLDLAQDGHRRVAENLHPWPRRLPAPALREHGLPKSAPLASILWLLTQRVFGRSEPQRLTDSDAVARFLSSSLGCLASELNSWARSHASEASTLCLLQASGKRRADPTLKQALAAKRRRGQAVRDWRADGAAVPISAEHTDFATCGHYIQQTRQAFGACPTVELVFDSSRFGGLDTDVVAIWSPEVEIAGYLPPQNVRELRWRESGAGEPMSADDRSRLRQRGLRAAPGMKGLDVLRRLSHALTMGAGRFLEDFKCPVRFEPLTAQQVRYWSSRHKRYMRRARDAPALADGAVEEEPELPDAVRDASRVPLLITVSDQVQWQWSAMQFLSHPEGVRLMHVFRVDPFHRGWNNFKAACRAAHGHFLHTVIQMTVAFNVNYGPWLNAAFMGEKREALLEYRLDQTDKEVWACLVDNVAADCRAAPPGSAEEQEGLFEDTVLRNPSFLKKGPYVKMCTWYSILEAIEYHDPVWTSWKHLVQWLGSSLLSPTSAVAREAQNHATAVIAAASSDGAPAPAEHRAQLQTLKKSAGNALRLTPLLLTGENHLNCRLLVMIARPLWTQQARLAREKKTPARQLLHSAAMAAGAGEVLISQLWAPTFEAAELLRLGITADADVAPYPMSVGQEEALQRLCSFAFHLMEEEVWTAAWWESAYPGQFARLLHASPEQSQAAMEDARAVWELLLLCEQLAQSRAGVAALLGEIHWAHYAINQLTWRHLADRGWQLEPDVRNHLTRMFCTLGDSKVIEDSHNHLRDLERDQRRNAVSRTRLFADLTKSPALRARAVPCVGTPPEAWHSPAPKPPPVPSKGGDEGGRGRWADVFRSEASKLSPEFTKLLKSKAHKPRTPRTEVGSITALAALLALRQRKELHLAGLCPAPGRAVGTALFVVNVAFTLTQQNYCSIMFSNLGPVRPVAVPCPGAKNRCNLCARLAAFPALEPPRLAELRAVAQNAGGEPRQGALLRDREPPVRRQGCCSSAHGSRLALPGLLPAPAVANAH